MRAYFFTLLALFGLTACSGANNSEEARWALKGAEVITAEAKALVADSPWCFEDAEAGNRYEVVLHFDDLKGAALLRVYGLDRSGKRNSRVEDCANARWGLKDDHLRIQGCQTAFSVSYRLGRKGVARFCERQNSRNCVTVLSYLEDFDCEI